MAEIILTHEISMKKLGNEEIQVGKYNKRTIEMGTKTIEMATKEMTTRTHTTSPSKTHITTLPNTRTHTTSQANTNPPPTKTSSPNTTT